MRLHQAKMDMMKLIISIVSAGVLFASCSKPVGSKSEQGNQSAAVNLPSPSPSSIPPVSSVKDRSSQELFNQFLDIPADTIHVFFDSKDQPIKEPFTGRLMDTSFFKLLNGANLLRPFDPESDRLFSCFRFAMGHDRTGFLVRVPSQYEESAVDLFVWNNVDNRFESRHELSDGFGDEGWHFNQESWILDLNHDGTLDIVTRKIEVDAEDSSAKGNRTNSRTDSLFLYLADHNYHFKKATLSLDTNSFHMSTVR